MKISPANKNQLDDIIAIENASFTCPWSRQSFEEAMNSDNIRVLTVTDEENRVLAFSCLLIIEYEAEILNIAVSENFRNRGIGKLLADHMVSICHEKDVTDIFLEVRDSNISAQHLYEKCEFKAIGKRKKYYTNPTEDAILMKYSFPDKI